MRVAATLLSLLVAEAALACSSLPLHVHEGAGGPLAFETTQVSFPHVRTTLAAIEQYRVADRGIDDWPSQVLHVRKGPGPGEVTLLTTPACSPEVSFADGAVFSRDLHVATNGRAGAAGTLADPFANIQQAAGVAGPGDRIVVHEGAYPGGEFIDSLQGTEAQPILITGAPGEATPVIGSPAVSQALHFVNPAWVILQDIIVDGPTGNGINIDDGGDYSTPAHHVVVRRVTIRDIGTGGNQDCLKLSGLDDFLVEDSSFLRCGGGGSAIDMVGCHAGIIRSNELRDLGATGIQGKGGTADVVIRGNLFVNAGDRAMNLGGSTGLAFFRPIDAPHEAARLVAISNVVVGSQAPTAYVGCDACVVGNNTFYLPERWVTRILQETTDPRFVQCRDGLFINNIVVFDQATLRTFVNVGGNTMDQTFVFSNNLWFARDDPGFGGPNLPTPPIDPVVQQDPLLADPAAEDFHLLPMSPAAGAGICYPQIGPDRDDLCYLDPPAIGAHVAP